MAINLKGRHFLTLKDFTPDEIIWLLDLASDLKTKKRLGIPGDLLEGKNIVLLFEKTSTRTRCAFEVAAMDEGAGVTFLGSGDSQINKKESIEDTAMVLGRFFDGIEFRGFAQETVEKLAQYAGIPVWNGLTDLYHPTQVLADIMTIREYVHKPLTTIKFVYAGDARNNMGNSLMIGCVKLGMHFVALAPRELWPDEDLVHEMKQVARETGGSIECSDQLDAVRGADVLYTDVWVSMGEEAMFEERIRLLKDYQVNAKMVEMTGNDDVIFLHCLPAFHDLNTTVGKQIHEQYGLTAMECSDDVFRGTHSRVFDQAENRLHTIKAVITATIGR